MAVTAIYCCMKRNVTLKIGPMMSLVSWWTMTSYILYYDILHNEPATCYNNKLTSLIYDGDRAVDWKQAKNNGRFLSNQQDEVAGRGQEGG